MNFAIDLSWNAVFDVLRNYEIITRTGKRKNIVIRTTFSTLFWNNNVFKKCNNINNLLII